MFLQCQIGLSLCLCFQYIRPKTLRTFTWPLSSNMEDCFDGSFLTNNRTCKQQLKNLLFYLGLLEASWRTAPRHELWSNMQKIRMARLQVLSTKHVAKLFFWLHAEVNPWSTGVYCSLWRGDCAVFRRTTKEVALRLALGNIQVVESSSFFGFCWLKSFWNRYVICECIQIVVASRQWFLLLVFSIDNTYISFEQKFLMKIVTRDIFLLKQPIGWYGYENKMRKSCNWRTVIETIENESSLRKLVPKEMASNWQKLWKINLCPFSKALSKKTVTKFFPWTTKF